MTLIPFIDSEDRAEPSARSTTPDTHKPLHRPATPVNPDDLPDLFYGTTTKNLTVGLS